MIEDLKELREGISNLLKFISPKELKRSLETRIVSGKRSEVKVIIEVIVPKKKRWWNKLW